MQQVLIYCVSEVYWGTCGSCEKTAFKKTLCTLRRCVVSCTVTSDRITNQIPLVDSNFKTLLTNQGPYVSITTHITLSV